jgi:hypothetical protein
VAFAVEHGDSLTFGRDHFDAGVLQLREGCDTDTRAVRTPNVITNFQGAPFFSTRTVNPLRFGCFAAALVLAIARVRPARWFRPSQAVRK